MNHTHRDEHPDEQHPQAQYAYEPHPGGEHHSSPAAGGSAAGEEAPTKRRRWPWIVGIVVALVAGVGIGSGGETEPEIVTETETVTEEVEVEVEPADLEERREAAAAAEEENEELAESLDQRTADLDVREEELDERAESISASETEIEENTIPGSGVYRVGEDIQPGTYRSEGDSCYWARLAGFSGSLEDIIANDNVSGSAYVTIAPSDVAFETSRCGDWTRQ